MRLRIPGLAALVIASAGLTLVFVAADSLGQDAQPEASPSPAVSATPQAQAAADAPPPIAAIKRRDEQACLVDPAALEDLQRRRLELEERAKALSAREAELQSKERALKEEIAHLDALKDELAKGDALKKKENEEKVTKLVETFESMSPKSASQLLSSIDESLAVAAMQRISTQRLAKIMNLMEPGRSSRLSESLAGVRQAQRRVKAHSEKPIQSSKGGDKANGRDDSSNGNNADTDSADSSAAKPQG